MAIKTFINGQEGGVITFKGDTEPCAVYVNGERQDNISYIPTEASGESSVEYKSEYKKNIRTLQINGNTEQSQEKQIVDDITVPSNYADTTSYLGLPADTPLELPQGSSCTLSVSNFSGFLIDGTVNENLLICVAYTQEDIENGNYDALWSNGVSHTVEVTKSFYIGIGLDVVGDSTLFLNYSELWQQLRNVTIQANTTVAVPSYKYSGHIFNANDNGMSLVLRGNFEPTTVEIPSSITVGNSNIPLRFAKINGVNKDYVDKLVIDRINGTVKYYQNTGYYTYTGNEKFSQGSYPMSIKYNRYWSYTPSMNLTISTGKGRGYCTHFVYGDYNTPKNSVVFGLSNEYISFIVDKTLFPTVADFTDWLTLQATSGNPVSVIYPLKETETDLTKTDLGQALLALPTQNQTNIITITATPSVNLSVNYAKWGGG